MSATLKCIINLRNFKSPAITVNMPLNEINVLNRYDKLQSRIYIYFLIHQMLYATPIQTLIANNPPVLLFIAFISNSRDKSFIAKKKSSPKRDVHPVWCFSPIIRTLWVSPIKSNTMNVYVWHAKTPKGKEVSPDKSSNSYKYIQEMLFFVCGMSKYKNADLSFGFRSIFLGVKVFFFL